MLDFKPAKKTGKYKTDWAPDQPIEDLVEEINNYTGDNWDLSELPSAKVPKPLEPMLGDTLLAMDDNGWCLADDCRFYRREIEHYTRFLERRFEDIYFEEQDLPELAGIFDTDDNFNVYYIDLDWPEVYYIQYFPHIDRWQAQTDGGLEGSFYSNLLDAHNEMEEILACDNS